MIISNLQGRFGHSDDRERHGVFCAQNLQFVRFKHPGPLDLDPEADLMSAGHDFVI